MDLKKLDDIADLLCILSIVALALAMILLTAGVFEFGSYTTILMQYACVSTATIAFKWIVRIIKNKNIF